MLLFRLLYCVLLLYFFAVSPSYVSYGYHIVHFALLFRWRCCWLVSWLVGSQLLKVSTHTHARPHTHQCEQLYLFLLFERSRRARERCAHGTHSIGAERRRDDNDWKIGIFSAALQQQTATRCCCFFSFSFFVAVAIFFDNRFINKHTNTRTHTQVNFSIAGFTCYSSLLRFSRYAAVGVMQTTFLAWRICFSLLLSVIVLLVLLQSLLRVAVLQKKKT